MSKRLNEKLFDLDRDGLYPLHMPGHKRNISIASIDDDFGKKLKSAYDIDITEIDGFDNLHDAIDVIKDSEERAAKLFNSSETHFLINGATGGILSAILSVCLRGDKVIVARNSHISVFNAIEINELRPIYIEPAIVARSYVADGIQGCIEVSSIEKAIMENEDVKAIVITSPTYDGVISDIPGIVKTAHEYDIPVIVDEAHGALFYLEGRSAVQGKADIVINSTHKTLPSLTQTAVIHINGNIVNRERVRKFLRIFQTSSPSYILMGSIDYAVSVMEKNGNRLYRDFCIRTTKLKESLKKLRSLKYISRDMLIMEGVTDFDESKVLIATDGKIKGKTLYKILRNNYSLQPEMAAGNYVLLMTTLFDTDEGINRLEKALLEIDELISNKENFLQDEISSYPTDENKASDYKIRIDNLKKFLGEDSPYTVFAYPPGIPIIVRNEIITEEKLKNIEKAISQNLDIKWID